MRILAAIQGDLPRYMREELAVAEQAVTFGIQKRARRLRDALRADVVAGGLGERFSKTWRDRSYPKNGTSLSHASVVDAGTGRIGKLMIAAFDQGVTIRGKQRSWLAVPTPNAPKRGVGGKRIAPANFPTGTYGPLRFVFRPRGPSLLVVDNQAFGRKGGFRLSKSKASGPGRSGTATVVMFYLYKQVRLKRRLNVEPHMVAAERQLIFDIDAEFTRLTKVQR